MKRFIITEEEKKSILSLYEDATSLTVKKPKLAKKYNESATSLKFGDSDLIYLGYNDDGTISYYSEGVIDKNKKPIPIIPKSDGYLLGTNGKLTMSDIAVLNGLFYAGIPYHLGKEYKTKVDENIKNKSSKFNTYNSDWVKNNAQKYVEEYGPKGFYVG